MPQVTYPGVYVQEVPGGVHTITGVATSVAAFIGFFKEGDMDKASQIFGLSDFNRIFGGLDDCSEASYAISQFFLNGGTEAQVIRVAGGLPRIATIGIENIGETLIMTVSAKNHGVWGNNLRVTIDHNTTDAANLFNFNVIRYESTSAQATLIVSEKYLNLSVDPDHTRYFEDVINEGSELVRVKHDGDEADGLPAQNGTSGAALAADLSTLKNDKIIKVKIGSGAENDATIKFGATAVTDVAKIRPLLEKAIRTADADNSPAYTGATVEVVGGKFVITSGKNASTYTPAETIIIKESGTTTAKKLGLKTGEANVFENVQEYVLGITVAPADGAQAVGIAGNDGDEPGANELKGDPNQKSGLHALEDVDLFNILCIPRAADLDATNMDAVISTALAYCKKRRAFLIIDIPESENSVSDIKDWMDANNGFRDKNSAVYFPRVKIPDPMNEYRMRSVGASGTIAGLYSRIDSTRGVWKAAAGTEASLHGVSELDVNLTDPENGTLNPLAINCLRTFPIYGHISWGARTLDGADVAGSEWKYIPVRRLALFLEESLFRGTKWVVFEPNDEPLWAKIRLNLNAFMMNMFRQGAFQGSSPDQAFYVKCDAETTTQNDRNLGIVNIEVGFAPLKPAEFVVIKFQQIAGEV